jgi:2-polyprenyl-3-methyl-5-hydroxy-6-metoxy-1,4-benzoquinol methylase
MNLGYLIALLRTLKIPGLFPVIKDWQSFLRLHFIYAAIRSGLLTALHSPLTREELIQKLDVKRPEILDALLDVGLSLKELSYERGVYHIRGKRSKAVVGATGDIVASMIEANVTYYSSVYRQAPDRIHGAPLGDDLAHIGDLVARFSKIGEPFIRKFIKDIVKAKRDLRVLDIGCGSGLFLKSLYDLNHNAHGIGIDVDEQVVKQASENMQTWGLSSRFTIISGDICAMANEGPYDLVTLFNILYYFSLEQRLKVLQKVREVLSPDGVAAIAMNFKSGGMDLGAANLNMVNTSLRGLTPLPDLEEVTVQLEAVGFKRVSFQRLVPASTFYGITANIV